MSCSTLRTSLATKARTAGGGSLESDDFNLEDELELERERETDPYRPLARVLIFLYREKRDARLRLLWVLQRIARRRFILGGRQS